VPTQIIIDGHISDSWGLAWLQLAPGSHTVSFTHVGGYSDPPPQTVNVTAGATTTVTGTFTPRGTLRVLTSPSVPSQITVDGAPADNSGVWTDLPTGPHQVCFGAVTGYLPPGCQNANVSAGHETDITGTFTAESGAQGQSGLGTLRVTTTPSVPSQITITPQNGTSKIADTGGLNWLQLAPGTYTVAFSHVTGYTEPAPQTVTITSGTMQTVIGTFTPRGTLRVITSPAVNATVTVDGKPADNWGVWTDMPTGSHQVCFGAVSGYNPPPCQTATLTAGQETDITGTYTTSSGGSGGSASGCVFSGGQTPAFCDTFTSPAGTGNRSGQLDGTVWGVSRATGNENFSSPANGWATTQLNDCGNATSGIRPPNDIVICNGELHDSVTDGGTVTTLAMYPKQPFDFAGRTGTIVFDVSNDTQGSHAAWPELWVSDLPDPTPFTHEASWTAFPQNGFGIRFAGCTDSSGAGATCSRGENAVGVDSAVVVNNYAGNDSFMGGTLKVIGTDSVMKSSGPGQLNHYEVRVSQNQIDVYGTDPYTGTLNLATNPLRHLATIPNVNLGFTRGLVWVEDVHYNGNKFNTQGVHTFAWDNVGFDGPVLPKDLAFDVPDNPNGAADTGQNGAPGADLGYHIAPNSSLTLTDPGITGIGNASKGLLTFNFYDTADPFTINYAINGHAHSLAWPYPWKNSGSTKTIAIPINLSEVQTGNNAITFTTGNYDLTVMNVDLIMVGAGG
jgi:hypothetical protein